MNLGEIAMAVLFLVVFVVVPIVFTQMGRRRRSTIDPNLQECRHCGAQNNKDSRQCYCCGVGFVVPPSDGADPALIKRVKQADDSKTRSRVEAEALQAVKDVSPRADKTGE